MCFVETLPIVLVAPIGMFISTIHLRKHLPSIQDWPIGQWVLGLGFYDIGLEHARLWLPSLVVSWSTHGYVVPRHSSVETEIVLMNGLALLLVSGGVILLSYLYFVRLLISGPFFGGAIVPSLLWMSALALGFAITVRQFISRYKLRIVPSVRWHEDMPACALKSFGVQDMDQLMYFDEIIRTECTNDYMQISEMLRNRLVGLTEESDGERSSILWTPGLSLAFHRRRYRLPAENSVYTGMVVRAIEDFVWNQWSCLGAFFWIGSALFLFAAPTSLFLSLVLFLPFYGLKMRQNFLALVTSFRMEMVLRTTSSSSLEQQDELMMPGWVRRFSSFASSGTPQLRMFALGVACTSVGLVLIDLVVLWNSTASCASSANRGLTYLTTLLLGLALAGLYTLLLIWNALRVPAQYQPASSVSPGPDLPTDEDRQKPTGPSQQNQPLQGPPQPAVVTIQPQQLSYEPI